MSLYTWRPPTELQVKQRILSWLLCCVSGYTRSLALQTHMHAKHLRPVTRRSLNNAVMALDEAHIAMRAELGLMKEQNRG